MNFLADIFRDILNPEWKTEIDNPNEPIGEYSPQNNFSQVGDSIFTYTSAYDTPDEEDIMCKDRSRVLANMDMMPIQDDNPPKLYKVFGTLTSIDQMTIHPENVKEVLTRKILGEYTTVSQQEAAEIDQKEIEKAAESADVEATPEPEAPLFYLPGHEPPEGTPEIDEDEEYEYRLEHPEFTYSLPPLPDESPVSEFNSPTIDIAGNDDMGTDDSSEGSEPDSGVDVDV